jgi:hypothetical protein
VELSFNDSYDLLSEVVTEVKLTDTGNNILTVPVRVQVLNLYAYTPIDGFGVPESTDLLFHIENGVAGGIRFWPFGVIIGFALLNLRKKDRSGRRSKKEYYMT